jgi:hypothetical protein
MIGRPSVTSFQPRSSRLSRRSALQRLGGAGVLAGLAAAGGKRDVALAQEDGLPAPPPPELSLWTELIGFRPPVAIQESVNDRFSLPIVGGNVFQPVEDGVGPINLDYYPVTITDWPTVDGETFTPERLILYLREGTHLNALVEAADTEFSPYDADPDGPIWASSDPTGAVVHIDMALDIANPDDGAVVVTEAGIDYWIFSTLWTAGDLYHPVNGNRWFGFFLEDDGSYTFATLGADRVSTSVNDLLVADSIFEGADRLWLTLQRGLANFITAGGGTAIVGEAFSERYQWDGPDGVKGMYFNPTGEWIDV